MKMKMFKIYIAMGAIFFLFGCKDNLDVVPTDVFTSSNMWEGDEDIESSVYGMYSLLRDAFEANIIVWGEYRNGLWGAGTHGTLHNSDMVGISTSTMTPTNAYSNWAGIYRVINQANLLLKYTPSTATSQETRYFGLGQAYFVRAFCYFYLGRIWGDSPLALDGFESSEQEFNLERSPVLQVFDQVSSDLDSSSRYLTGAASDKTLATKASLSMLKADFGLWMYRVLQGGEEYLDMAQSAIESLGLTPSLLESSYADIFSAGNKLGKEVIWAIPQDLDESIGGFAGEQFFNRSFVNPTYINNEVPIGNNQWWFYTSKYIGILTSDASDTRIGTSYGFGPYGSNGEEIGWANKFSGEMISGTRVLDSDIPVYRYAQAFAFQAEIYYYRKMYSEALQALSPITQRAYGNSNYYAGLTGADVLDAIVTENLKEFASEGNTYWMLIRTDKIWDYSASLAQQRDKENILLWPVSRSVLNRNHSLIQTNGWQQ